MSTLAIGPHHREAPMLIVPSTAGFPLLLKSAGLVIAARSRRPRRIRPGRSRIGSVDGSWNGNDAMWRIKSVIRRSCSR